MMRRRRPCGMQTSAGTLHQRRTGCRATASTSLLASPRCAMAGPGCGHCVGAPQYLRDVCEIKQRNIRILNAHVSIAFSGSVALFRIFGNCVEPAVPARRDSSRNSLLLCTLKSLPDMDLRLRAVSLVVALPFLASGSESHWTRGS
jgi:hypothetical protein